MGNLIFDQKSHIVLMGKPTKVDKSQSSLKQTNGVR